MEEGHLDARRHRAPRVTGPRACAINRNAARLCKAHSHRLEPFLLGSDRLWYLVLNRNRNISLVYNTVSPSTSGTNAPSEIKNMTKNTMTESMTSCEIGRS